MRTQEFESIAPKRMEKGFLSTGPCLKNYRWNCWLLTISWMLRSLRGDLVDCGPKRRFRRYSVSPHKPRHAEWSTNIFVLHRRPCRLSSAKPHSATLESYPQSDHSCFAKFCSGSRVASSWIGVDPAG